MRARVLTSLLIVLLAAALIGGATLAYFSSTADVEESFTTGRVNLVPMTNRSLQIPMGGLAVGDIAEGSFTLYNWNSSLDIWFEVTHVFDENDTFWNHPNVELTITQNQKGVIWANTTPYPTVEYQVVIKDGDVGDVNLLQDLKDVVLKFEVHAEQLQNNQPQWLHFVPHGESIQSRIDAASAGDLILIHSGEFHEYLVIDKPLTLRGIDNVFTPDGARIMQVRDGNAIEIKSDNVALDNLRFVKDGESKHMQILVEGKENIQITGNRFEAFTDVSGAFIQLESGSHNVYIKGNNISGRNGARAGMIWVRNNVGDIQIVGNYIYDQFSEGVVVREGAGHLRILQNVIHQHSDSALTNIKIVGQPRSVNGLIHKYDIESDLLRQDLGEGVLLDW